MTRSHPYRSVALVVMFALAGYMMLSLLAHSLAHAGPADALRDPTAAPLDAWADLMAAKAHGGWVLLVLGASVMLARLATRLPWGVGAWLSVGRRAMAVSVWVTGGAVAFDGLSSGGSLATVAIAVVSALLALTHPTVPAPASGVTVTRAPQDGRVDALVLVTLAAWAALIITQLPACARVKGAAAVGVRSVLDCGTPDLKLVADDGWTYASQVIPAYIDGAGHVDANALKTGWQTLKSDAAKCFQAGGVAALLALLTQEPAKSVAQSAALTVDPGELRRAFAAATGGLRVSVAGQEL